MLKVALGTCPIDDSVQQFISAIAENEEESTLLKLLAIVNIADNEKTPSKITIRFISDPNKLAVVKIIKEELHIGLKEAKDCVDAGQLECTEEQWETMRPALQQAGACRFLT